MRYILKICFCIMWTLLLSIGVSAQKPLSADSISSLLLNLYAKTPQEKAYAHTDRAYYAVGDTIWFRVYIVDAATNRLIDRSKFVYVELLDNAADTLIKRIKIKSDSTGIFANALPISSQIKSGSYTLAAYTRWMQNFDEKLFFKKTIKIVNPRDSVIAPLKPRTITSIALDVMPEGGNLIAGHSQRIAYKAVGDDGLGVDVKVKLVNALGEVIMESASQHLGMGYILVNADADEELWLEAFNIDGISCRTKLPNAQTHGTSLSVSQHKGDVLIQPYATPSFDINRVTLALYGAGNMIVKELNDNAPIRIPTKRLNPGVINIALIDRFSRQTLAERLIFIRDSNPANTKIKITPE